MPEARDPCHLPPKSFTLRSSCEEKGRSRLEVLFSVPLADQVPDILTFWTCILLLLFHGLFILCTNTNAIKSCFPVPSLNRVAHSLSLEDQGLKPEHLQVMLAQKPKAQCGY